MLSGNVFNIQRFSTDDGPGIRTTVFLKGCPLRCLWCSNPESQSAARQVAHRDSLCTGCGSCIKACPAGAIRVVPVNEGFRAGIDRAKCDACGACVDVCGAGAMQFYGRTMIVDEVFDEIKKDTGYYTKSQGGVTASGGEPLSQADFVAELFRRCQKMGIHTALDTCGYARPDTLNRVLEFTDLVLLDIKLMDRLMHKQYTGKYNDIILRNARLIAQKGVPMVIRIPLIPNINDSETNITDTARFVSEIGNTLRVDLLPYHNYGEKKYEMLDMNYQLPDTPRPDAERLHKYMEIFSRCGIECAVH